MNEIQLFDNGEFKIEVTADGDSFTVGAPGLARALGSRDALTKLVEGRRPRPSGRGKPGILPGALLLNPPVVRHEHGARFAAFLNHEVVPSEVGVVDAAAELIAQLVGPDAFRIHSPDDTNHPIGTSGTISTVQLRYNFRIYPV